MLIGMFWGGLIGAGVAVAGFEFRRRAWASADLTGTLGLGILVIMAVLLGGFGVITAGKGGDSAIAGMTLLIFLVLGVLVAALFVTLAASFQSPRLGRPWFAVLRSVMLEPVVVGILAWSVISGAITSAQRAIVEDWVAQETARNTRVRLAREAVPEKYRDKTQVEIDMDDWQVSEAAKHGFKSEPNIPPDVKAKLRAYWQASAQPQPIPDRTNQTELSERKSALMRAAPVAWFVVAVLWPLVYRRPTGEPGVDA